MLDRRIRLFAAIAGLALMPTVALALPVTWELRGTLHTAQGSDLSPLITPTSPFAFRVQFDTDLPPASNPLACGGGGAGSTCRYTGGLVPRFVDLRVGGLSEPEFTADQASNLILIRNDAPSSAGPVDGISFGTRRSFADGEFINFLVIFRGPQRLDVVTDATRLPGDPPSGLLDLGERTFEVCHSSAQPGDDCDLTLVRGTVDSVSRVPEPATAGLLALALGALGASRRRRH